MWESKLFLTWLHWTIQNILLAANPLTAFLQEASWPGKNKLKCMLLTIQCAGIKSALNGMSKMPEGIKLVTLSQYMKITVAIS